MLEFDQLIYQIENEKEPLKELRDALGIDAEKLRIDELERRSAQPELWKDPDYAKRIQQELAALKKKQSSFQKLTAELEDMEVLCEIGQEEEDKSLVHEIEDKLHRWKKERENLKMETFFTDPLDSHNCIISLHAGAGGTEACDWTSMLFRMYSRWAEQHDYLVHVLDSEDEEEGGIRSISFKVEGNNAYGYLKHEMGVHRLVRISPFDTQGRRHTSFASAEVLPELDESIEINIRPEDLRVDYYRSSGAGGQHVNKTSSAVRLTHLPTGIVVACQNERSQIQNKEVAMQLLKAKLYTLAQKAQLERVEDLKGDQMDIGWGSQIRSYVFCPYTLVKDNRSGAQTADVDAVMDGDLDPFISAMLSKAAAESAGRP